MTTQTVRGVYDMCDDMLGGAAGNPDKVIVAVHHALAWIDVNAAKTDWRSIIETMFDCYVEAFVYGRGRVALDEDTLEDCAYLRSNLGLVIDRSGKVVDDTDLLDVFI